jgi:transcriptional regulator with XRE-family HTH domain
MDIATRLREIRHWKNLSQGHIEQRTGLLRCYISRVENGHTVPSIETLEKITRALGIPMYQLFFPEELPAQVNSQVEDWSTLRNGKGMLRKFKRALQHMSEEDRNLLLFTASKMVKKRSS